MASPYDPPRRPGLSIGLPGAIAFQNPVTRSMANSSTSRPRTRTGSGLTRPRFDGVTGGFNTTRPARSVTGRNLSIGQDVGGVATFSDGTGGVPRTLGADAINTLQQGNRTTSIPAISRPAPGVAYSQATGGQTLQLGQLRRPEAPMFSRQVDPVRSAQLSATRDVEDIASGNMLSSLGRAASNLRRRASSGDAAAQTQLDALIAGAGSGIEPAARLEDTRLREAGADRRTAVDAATAIETTRLSRPDIQPQAVQQADGSLALVRPDGTAQLATLTDGTLVRPAASTSAADVRSRDSALNRVQRNLQTLVEQAGLQSGGQLAPDQLRDLRIQALQLEGAQIAEDDAGNMLYSLNGGQWLPL